MRFIISWILSTIKRKKWNSNLVPKYSRTVNGFDEKVIAMYALGLSDKDIQKQIKDIFGCNLSLDMIRRYNG